MKKIMLYLLTGILFSLMNSNPIAAQTTSCANGGFEDGNFSNWTGKYGMRNAEGIPFDELTNGFDPGHHTLTTPGFDPNIGGTLLSTVGEGNYAIRIGDADGGLETSVISYSFTVTPANKDFSFRFAMVMEDGNVVGEHVGIENPYFGFYILSSDPFSPVIDLETYIADNTDPFFTVTNGWAWRDWSQKCYDLKKYMGKRVTAIFFVADCEFNGHGAYAYIDGLCGDNGATAAFNIPSEICFDDDLIADGSPSTNEDHHFWSIQESGADWVAIGPEYSQWFTAEQAGTINLKSFLASKGGTLKCNTYYRVKLAVSSECTSWHAETKLIYVRCPEVIELKDRFFCCDQDNPSVIFGPLGPGLTYKWVVYPSSVPYAGYIRTDETLSIDPNENMRIVVTVTDANGCSYTQEFNIWVLYRYEVTISSQPEGCCKEKLTAHVNFIDGECGTFHQLSQAEQADIFEQLDFYWSNGDTGPSTIAGEPGTEVYTVNVKGLNHCMDASASYTYTSSDKYTPTAIYDREMIAPNSFTPNGDGTNDVYQIFEFGPDAPLIGEPNAYGIIGYHLFVFDRWGEIIYEHKDESCNIPQGGIQWNGTTNSGILVPGGVYIYKLYVKTCNGPNGTWHPVCDINGVNSAYDACVEGHTCVFCWPPFSYVCDEWWTPNNEDAYLPDGDNETCIFSVNVLR